MELEFTKEERESIMERVVAALIAKYYEDFQLLSPAQTAGIIDISPKSLGELDGLPRITIIPRQVIRYRLGDLKAWLDANRA